MTRLLTILCALALTALPASAALTHRYSFTDGPKDAVGNVDGKLVGPAKVADGKLTLKNEITSGDQGVSYVEFAGPILPKTGSVTLVAWFTAQDIGNYGRIFNFGDAEAGQGKAFLYFTPKTAEEKSRAAITATDLEDKTALDNARLDDGKPHMVAVVVDGPAKKLHVYIDGKEPTPPADLGDNTLDKVKQVQNWLGRSSFDNDPALSATLDEFRVYDHALSAEEITAAQKAGPDALPPATQPATAPTK